MSRATIIHTDKGSFLSMPCPRFGTCHPKPLVHRAESGTIDGVRVWQWIGTEDSPTIRPSVGCDAKCGEHRVITDGTWGKP
jgi:hypothetical protein